jgi:acyl-CoA thioester hydrolase
MDSFSHVNNACYLTYFEESRIGYMNELVGWKYDWSKHGVIVARAEIDFKLPAFFKDEIYVYLGCSHIGTKSFTLDYKMVRINAGLEELLSTGKTVLVMYDYSTGQSIAIPDDWRSGLTSIPSK